MKARYISNQFGEKVLERGTIKFHYETMCDNGKAEMIVATYTNGVDFTIMKLNGQIISVA